MTVERHEFIGDEHGACRICDNPKANAIHVAPQKKEKGEIVPEGMKLVDARYQYPVHCDCIHPPAAHDKLHGACHYTNTMLGPCPCRATPGEVREAQTVAWKMAKATR